MLDDSYYGLEIAILRDNSFKFLPYQLVDSVLDYRDIDG